jgi:hypothetical protein
MQAITKEGKYIGIKAISPDGKMNDVKGIKLNKGEKEMNLKGIGVHAHVKAMRPAVNEDKLKMFKKSAIDKKRIYKTDFKRIPWKVNAVTADGIKLAVKAIDPEGNQFDVQATQDSEQHSFMNVKIFVDGYELPVKILQSDDKHAPINAIGAKGEIYEIKAITADNIQFELKGVNRLGRIIHVKALNQNGEFLDVKAFAPDGKVNEINGIKVFDKDVEMKIQGHLVHAHVKALNQ